MARAKKPRNDTIPGLKKKQRPKVERKAEMTPEQKAAWDALTPLQQLMAPHILSGRRIADAYRIAKGEAADTMNQNTLRVVARQIAAQPTMKAYLDAMNCELVNAWIMQREEALERLTIIGRANLGDFIDFGEYQVGTDEDGNPVVQATWKLKDQAKIDPDLMAAVSELSAGKDGLKIKLHPALAALKQLAEMQGWDAPVKVQPLQPKTLDDFYSDVDQAEGSATADA